MGCGVWSVGFGVRGAGCGVRGAGCGVCGEFFKTSVRVLLTCILIFKLKLKNDLFIFDSYKSYSQRLFRKL